LGYILATLIQIRLVTLLKNKDFRFPVSISVGVARWYIFKPKIPIWINFGRPWNEKGWHNL
jgi:hypothetical protein